MKAFLHGGPADGHEMEVPSTAPMTLFVAIPQEITSTFDVFKPAQIQFAEYMYWFTEYQGSLKDMTARYDWASSKKPEKTC